MANLRTNNLCGVGFVSVNDGTIWSSLFEGSTLGSYPVTHAFDGSISTFMYPAAGTQITWTAPNGGIKGDLIEVYVYAGNTHPIVTVNGVSTGAVVGSDYGQQGNWVDVTSLVGGNLKTITCFGETIGGVARQSGFSAVRINGEVLIDGEYGTTGGKQAYRGSVPFNDDDYLQIADSADIEIGSNDYTVEFWAIFSKKTSSTDYEEIVNKGYPFQIYRYTANDNIALAVDSNTSSYDINATFGTATRGHWHHIAVSRSGNTTKAFLNGIQGLSSTSSTSINDTGSAFTIGAYADSLGSYKFRGVISNVRVVIGTALYTADFTPPTKELTIVDGTAILCCQDSNDPTQEATGKTITGFGDLATAGYLETQPKVIPPYGVDAGNAFGGPIQQSSQGYMYFPTGRTEERGRGRAIWGGGSASPNEQDVMDYLHIQSSGTAIDFGALSDSRNEVRACGSSTRGVWAGGRSPHPSVTDVMDFVEIVTTANAIDFGNLTVARAAVAAVSNQTRGCFMAGFGPSNLNVIDFITIATTGNASDFGDMLGTYQAQARAMSPTRGLAAGNYGASNLIEFITIATTGNSTDFGDRTVAAYSASGTSDNTRGVFTGGDGTPNTTNVIDFVTMASAGNATDFGDLVTANGSSHADTSNSIVGCIGGGASNTNAIEKIIIQTTGNAVDYGDLSVGRSQLGATSDSHGGLS